MTAKQKNSRFFESFIQKYGERATLDASDEEVYKQLRTFYTDLTYGNIQQEKYIQYLFSDSRLLEMARQDSESKMIKAGIVAQSLQFARANNFPPTLNGSFEQTYTEANAKYTCYTIINQGITHFASTGNINYLIQIAMHFANPMNRLLRPEL